MTWILASLIMFGSSAVMYLLVRHAQKQGVSHPTQSLALFVIPLPFYILYGLVKNEALLPTTITQLGLLITTGLLFAWLGNWFSLRAMAAAPNPGYSLIISKSYVVYTAVVSIWLFNSELTLKSLVAILSIIAFSTIIVLADKRTSHEVHSLQWFWLTMGAFFCWGNLALMSKYMLNLGVSVSTRSLWVAAVVSMIVLLEIFSKKATKVHFSELKTNWPLLVAIGFCGSLFNLFMQVGIQLAPNPGYVNAVNASSISVLTLLAAYFFKDELNPKKLVGIFGVTAGLLLLFL